MITKEEAIAFEKQIEDMDKKEDRGPNDLELRIEDLMRVNLSHQNLKREVNTLSICTINLKKRKKIYIVKVRVC
jgi:hypothetical protein